MKIFSRYNRQAYAELVPKKETPHGSWSVRGKSENITKAIIHKSTKKRSQD